MSTTPENHSIDLFGVPGHRFWIEVSDDQLAKMNQGRGGFPYYGGGDIYTPGGSGTTFAEHVLVEDFFTKSVADYGKLEVKLVGESTFRPWDEWNIPNVRIDTDEFQPGLEIDDHEHLRLNNSLVGTIFREHIAHRIYRELGYPALRSSYAFLGSNVWGEGVWTPMTLIEVYKCETLEDRTDVLGGECVNMWEFAGQVGGGYGGIPADACQNHECDDTRLLELDSLVSEQRNLDGFMLALEGYIDWDYYQRYQCLNWILWVGDDPIHNGNNNLIIERNDGRMVWAPYSVDISAGQDWYQNVPLTGTSPISLGCQTDPECWAGTIAACEVLIDEFKALAPETIVDETEELLREHDMLRDGDEQRAEDLREWFVQRQLDLDAELEVYRYLPDVHGNCPEGLEACQDQTCGTSEQCLERRCGVDQEWCETFGYCINPNYEFCPDCADPVPFWCHLNQQCVPAQADCAAYCEQQGVPYCEAYDDCGWGGECYDYYYYPYVVEPLPVDF